MSSDKLIRTGIRREKNGQMVVTTARAGPKPCKGCGKNPRRPGSSWCEDCSRGKKVQDLNNDRLQKKIDRAAGINS